MNWSTEPASWNTEGDTLTVTAAPQTDFWRKTHSGHISNNGHFYSETVKGDFTAEVEFSGEYRDLYDQAGLMLRIDDEHWIKTGIELLDGVQQVSAVVTRDFSDWSVIALPENPPTLWLRLQRKAHTVEIYYSLDGSSYILFRQAYFPPNDEVEIGRMICAPRGNGFTTVFRGYKVTS